MTRRNHVRSAHDRRTVCIHSSGHPLSPTRLLHVETCASFGGCGPNYTPQTLMTEVRELRA